MNILDLERLLVAIPSSDLFKWAVDVCGGLLPPKKFFVAFKRCYYAIAVALVAESLGIVTTWEGCYETPRHAIATLQRMGEQTIIDRMERNESGHVFRMVPEEERPVALPPFLPFAGETLQGVNPHNASA
eukprot:GHVU01094381.1.p1 GENE.GHVU01094381.1~~GHVU01094381.1.p1  ORF type:complete len:130 (-),score=17.27 GHVU01094381.1:233-622(-)